MVNTMSMTKTTLVSTGEVVQPVAKNQTTSQSAPQGYTDVLIPRQGMKGSRLAVTERVRNSKLKDEKV